MNDNFKYSQDSQRVFCDNKNFLFGGTIKFLRVYWQEMSNLKLTRDIRREKIHLYIKCYIPLYKLLGFSEDGYH